MKADLLQISPMDRESAREIVQWRYPPPYEVYNISANDAESAITAFLNPDYAYYRINDVHGRLIAFFNFGLDARVPGGDYSQDALDIGLGVHPGLTGQGKGATYVNAVLDFACGKINPSLYRVTIAEFNQRAQRAWQKAGFTLQARFQHPKTWMAFLIFTADSQKIKTG